MRYQEVIKEIDRHSWWSEEAPGMIQMILYPLHSFIEQSRVLHPKLLTIAIMIFVKGVYFYEKTPEDEKYIVYQYVFKRMKQNKNYLKELIKDTKKKERIYFNECSNFIKNKDQMNNRQLYRSYISFMNKYVDYLGYPAGIECIDILTAYHLEDIAKEELPKLSQERFRDIIITLTSPKKLSFMEKERIDFLKICLANHDGLRRNELTTKLKKQLDGLSKKYFYVLNNFKDVHFLDSAYFFKKGKEEARKNKRVLQSEINSLQNKIKELERKEKEIYKKYKFSQDLKLHFKITEILGESIDDRKSNMIRTNYYIKLYCEEIAKRFSMDVWDIKNYTAEEIKGLLLYNKPAGKDFLKRKAGHAAYVMRRAKKGGVKAKWFYGKEAETILKKTSHVISDKITGQVANAPVKKISGTAQVVLDVAEQKFKEGNILVATMTRPEFVPLMRKAKAIITDEGGITCHAAVVSRELKIPCIIGTKIATKVLKDGDMVEVDADGGVVRRVK